MIEFVTDKFENGKIKYEGKYVFDIFININQQNNTQFKMRDYHDKKFFNPGKLFQMVADIEIELEFGSTCKSWNENLINVGDIMLRLPVDCSQSLKIIETEITDCFTNEEFKEELISQCFSLDINGPYVLEEFNDGSILDQDTYDNIIKKAKKLLVQKHMEEN